MSRARDMANLGVQAGSGLDASDITTGTFSTSVIPNLAGDKITSGTLSNTVQDNITRLGNVASGTLSLSTDDIIGLASSTFNGVGMILGCSFGSTTSEFGPTDASWYAQITISHAMQHSSHYIFCIGALSWYAETGSNGQVGIFATDNSNNNFSASQKIYSTGSGVYSLWSGSGGGQIADIAPQFGMFKPGNTNTNKYSLSLAEEGGTQFRGQSEGTRSWLIAFECTGVA